MNSMFNGYELGSLQENLILNTAGKIKIRYGSKYIDLLDENGEINVSPLLLQRIQQLEEEIKALKK